MAGTLVLLKGSHSTFVRDASPKEVRSRLRRQLQDHEPGDDLFVPLFDGDRELLIHWMSVVALVPVD